MISYWEVDCHLVMVSDLQLILITRMLQRNTLAVTLYSTTFGQVSRPVCGSPLLMFPCLSIGTSGHGPSPSLFHWLVFCSYYRNNIISTCWMHFFSTLVAKRVNLLRELTC